MDLLKEFKEPLVSKLGVGVLGAFFGVFPLFGCKEGFCEVLLAGLGFDSASDSPTVAKRERFGEGGGRLRMTTDQHEVRLGRIGTYKTSTLLGLASDPFWEIERVSH